MEGGQTAIRKRVGGFLKGRSIPVWRLPHQFSYRFFALALMLLMLESGVGASLASPQSSAQPAPQDSTAKPKKRPPPRLITERDADRSKADTLRPRQ
jgi:hypothetical protein